MPLVKKIETEIGPLRIWALNESSEDLSQEYFFSERERLEFLKIKSEKRKTEYLAARILLKNILEDKTEINYQISGKPFLNNSESEISISHSAEFVAVLVSEKKIGIDVENTQRNIDKVANRFLHSKELDFMNSLDDSQIAKILFWSAKEAIFKCTESEGILFNSQIFIPPFEIRKEGWFTGILNNSVQYKLWYFFYENNVIVYCVEE